MRRIPIPLLAALFILTGSDHHDEAISGSESDPRRMFDRHTESSAKDGTPSAGVMMDGGGVLTFNDGCLFLQRRHEKLGLIMPPNSKRQNDKIISRNKVYLIGKNTGYWVSWSKMMAGVVTAAIPK